MDTKINEVRHENLGEVGEVVVTKDDTLFLKGKGDALEVQARCEQLKEEIESTNSEYEKEKLNERLAKLSDGVAIIKVRFFIYEFIFTSSTLRFSHCFPEQLFPKYELV